MLAKHDGDVVVLDERANLHEKWIDEVIEAAVEKGELRQDRHAVVIAGAPGIVKGTV